MPPQIPLQTVQYYTCRGVAVAGEINAYLAANPTMRIVFVTPIRSTGRSGLAETNRMGLLVVYQEQ